MSRFLLVALLCILAACGKKAPSSTASSPDGKTVITTFYPTQYFAQRIAGEHLNVVCPVPEDTDPIFWRPDRATLQKYQSADLIIINGADFEKWIATASLPENRIINTTKSIEQDFIKYQTSTTHKHGNDGEEHTHTGIDGHTWLDPITAKIQAATIHQTLAKKWPTHAADFEKNLQALVTDLDALDDAFKKLDLKQPLLASHPAYNYLARRYAWKITNLDFDPEIIPPRDAISPDHPAKIILWESEPREKIVALLEKTHGIKSIVFSPAKRRGEQDYLATMEDNIERLKAATR